MIAIGEAMMAEDVEWVVVEYTLTIGTKGSSEVVGTAAGRG